MNKEAILALLLLKFAGVRKDALTNLARSIALQVETEDEAKALVEKLTKEKVEAFQKEFRADVDKEVSESKKTIEENLKKKQDEDAAEEKRKADEKAAAEAAGKSTSTSDATNADAIAAAIKSAVAEAVAPLQKELAGFKAGEVTKTRLQSLTEKLSVCTDETFKAKILKDFGRMKFETDDEFNEYLSDTETDIASANQNAADNSLGGMTFPFNGKGNAGGKPVSQDEIKEIME